MRLSMRSGVFSFTRSGALPPPLWGRVGEGGRSFVLRSFPHDGPPPLTLPHKGEGNRAERVKENRAERVKENRAEFGESQL